MITEIVLDLFEVVGIVELNMKTPCLVVKVSWFMSLPSLNYRGGVISDLVPIDRTLLSLVRINRGNVVMDSVSSSRFLEPSFETMYIIVCVGGREGGSHAACRGMTFLSPKNLKNIQIIQNIEKC